MKSYYLQIATLGFLLKPAGRYIPTTYASRSFGSSATCYKSRHKAVIPRTPELTEASPPSIAIKYIRLPIGIKEWEVLSYPLFMKKLQKLNPSVQFTRSLADEALEKSVRGLMPKAVWGHVQRAVRGQTKHNSSGKINAKQLVQNWRRLQTESEAYWAEE